MYQSVFGGFDYTIYANSTLTTEYYGRIFMSLFLLGFAVLVMNFLIAILSEVYSNFTGVANALQMREITKLRAIYEPHKHFYCLVKAPMLINFYMVIMAPLVILFKSEKLNNALILFQYSIILIFFEIGLIVNLTISLPIIVVTFIFMKLAYISSKSKGALDALRRIVDLIVLIFTIEVYIIILYTAAIISETKLLFKTNLIRIVGIYSKQYRYINKIMDGSIQNKDKASLDSVDNQKTYFRFKKFVNPLRSKTVNYDPTNFMISEVAASLMIACMKIIKRDVQLSINNGEIDDSIPLFIPTEYVIEELHKVICLNEQFKSLFFGTTYSKIVNVESPQLKYLISTLADKTLGGLEYHQDKPDSPESIDDGENLIYLVATLSSHEQRVKYWRNKLFKLFTESNHQWLIDQFQTCKVFLYLNSFEADFGEVKEEIWQTNEQLKLLYSKYQKRTNKNIEDKWENTKADEFVSTQAEEYQQKIHLIDIPTFIGPIVGFEAKIRSIIKHETKNGEVPVSKQLRKKLKAKNQVTLTRFLSSCMSTCYTACNTYANKE